MTTQTSETVTDTEDLEAGGNKGYLSSLFSVYFLNVYELFYLHLCTWTTYVQCSKEPDKGARYPGLGLGVTTYVLEKIKKLWSL